MNARRALLLAGFLCLAWGTLRAKPRFAFPSTPDQVGQNDRDLDDDIMVMSSTQPGSPIYIILRTTNTWTARQNFNGDVYINGSSATIASLLSSSNTWTSYQVHKSSIDIQSGAVAGLIIGADNNATTRTVNTAKRFRMASYPYDNGTMVALLYGLNDTSASDLYLGGGTLGENAVTGVHIYTAANNSTVVGTERWAVDGSGNVTQPTNASFLVTNSTGPSNFTGDGVTYTMQWPTEVTDAGSNFATDTFTAPVTGKYLLTVGVALTGVTATHSYRYIDILTSNRLYFKQVNQLIQNDFYSMGTSVVADMDAGDTAKIRIEVGGGTHVVDLNASGQGNYFSGTLLN